MGINLTELGQKIFLDRYAMKDIKRETLAEGDLVIALVTPHPRYPQNELGNIVGLDLSKNSIFVELTTGPTKGQIIDRPIEQIWKPIELTPEQAWARMAKAAASIEKPEERANYEDKFYKLLEDFAMVPGGRIYAGLGSESEKTLFNCYVIQPPHDSMKGILTAAIDMVEIMRRGGGVGINVSTLRPTDSIVYSVDGTSSGSVSFMDLYSFLTNLIQQGGSRRGALMLMMHIWHPDIIRFITCKNDPNFCLGANISVLTNKKFRQALKDDADWEFIYPDYGFSESVKDHYDQNWHSYYEGDIEKWIKDGFPIKVYGKIKARELWNLIHENAWKSAEPGIVDYDLYNDMSNSWYFNPIICTNPCGEQGLPAWGVCNLNHINLANPRYRNGKEINYAQLEHDQKLAVRFADNIITINIFHDERIAKNAIGERRIGLGTLGLGELMEKLHIPYKNKPESIAFIDQLFEKLCVWAYEESIVLAEERGMFDFCQPELHVQSGFMKQLIAAHPHIGEGVLKHGIRNVTLITEAPTGSTGSMVSTTTGIEPRFANANIRVSRLGVDVELGGPAVKYMQENPGVKEFPEWMSTAMDLNPFDHVLIQATIQKWVDSSISKTANCPSDFTVEQTKELYDYAFETGCKGVTIYRDGSRMEQILIPISLEEIIIVDGKPTVKDPKKFAKFLDVNPSNQSSDDSNVQIETVGSIEVYEVGREEPIEYLMTYEEMIDNNICPKCSSKLYQEVKCKKCTSPDCDFEGICSI
jgi:ribonucleoside-diphosphate reductase alpha chain